MIKEEYIIHHLINEPKFFSKAFTALNPDFFEDVTAKKVFTKFKHLVERKLNNSCPSEEDLLSTLSSNENEQNYKELKEFIEKTKNTPTTKNIEWFINEAETWTQEQSTRLAIEETINIYQNNKNELGKIKAIFDENSKVGFNKSIGLSLVESVKERFHNYSPDVFIKTGFKPFDNLVGGGLFPTALYILQAATNVGKTYVMNFLATEMVKQGRKVLFVSHEENQKKGFSRTDANLLETPTAEFYDMGYENWKKNGKNCRWPSRRSRYYNKICSG